MSQQQASVTVDSVNVGDTLPALEIPITTRLIVGAAIASRDYQNVHHDLEATQALGSPNIFMNILTTNGLVGRFITDWTGPLSVLKRVNIKLGAPNYPGDTMTLTGEVTAVDPDSGRVDVEVKGRNSLGYHVTGEVAVVLPSAS